MPPPPPPLLLPLSPPPSSCLKQPNPASVSIRRRAALSPRREGEEREGTGEPGSVSHHPIPHALSHSALSSAGTRPPSPLTLPNPHPRRPPLRVQRRAEGTHRPWGFPSPSLESRLQNPTPGSAPQPSARFPPPGSSQPTADPFLPFPGAPRPVSPRAAAAQRDPAPGRGRPRLSSAEYWGKTDPFLTLPGEGLAALTFTVFVVAFLTPTSAPRYQLTRSGNRSPKGELGRAD
nr:proline-rich receptor-like protein kinase PERK2 [Manis javanica]